MSVFRVNKTKNYSVISNYHFKEKGMSLKAKGLLSLMLSLPDDWNYNISGLTKLSKDGKDSVMSALNELEKFGYLIRVRLVNEKGQFNGVEYNIFEEPQQEIPVADMPNPANEKAEKGNTDKPPLLNTNKLNTKRLNTEVVKGETTEPQPPITLLLNTGEEYPIMQADIDTFKKSYESINPLSVLKNISAWLYANPQKRRTAEETNLLIFRWLNEENQKAKNKPATTSQPRKKNNSFNNFHQRQYDFDEYEKMLLTTSVS